jgi:hypothetical protein
MRMRTKKNNGHHGGGKSGAGSRTEKSVTNQLAFNVICAAISVGGDANTEPCHSAYND